MPDRRGLLLDAFGYIPGIAALAAGVLSPIATMLIVLLTLFGMLPMYRVVSEESPHGQGSISMLERLLSFWKGKVFVLCLLGFVATSWVITITLSASDAAVHIAENPLVPASFRDQDVLITLVLVGLLGAVFLKGFKEAIGIAVVVVGAYLSVNLVVVAVGLYSILTQPQTFTGWQDALFTNFGNPLTMIAVSLLVFPRLALGLSGFETGVSMMPLVRGDEGDDPEHPAGRIRNTRKMLTVAALIMSFYLITTSFVTAVLIPHEEFEKGGSANGRALAYLAHNFLGDGFGTVYDLSTITILWLAEPERAIALFRDQERRHEERLLEYERIRAWMEEEWGEDVLRPDSPRFASYAALQRGIIYERGYAEWCRWVAGRLGEGRRSKRSGGRRTI